MASKIARMAKTSELFQKKLRHAALLHGLSQADIARELGLQRQFVQRYLSGASPSPELLGKLAKILEVDLNWLCNDADESFDPPESELKQPRLEDVPEDDLWYELARRMRVIALDLDKVLKQIEAGNHHWEHVAVFFLTNQVGMDDLKMRQYVQLALRLEKLCVQILGYINLDDYNEIYHYMLPGSIDTEIEDVSPRKLMDRVDALNLKHPGINALVLGVDKIRLLEEKHGKETDEEKRQFVDEVRYQAAKLVVAPPLVEDKNFDAVRAKLREGGYIDEQNRPSIPARDDNK